MRRLLALIVLCASSMAIYGQTASVTATVTDLDGNTWNAGRWSATLASPNGTPTINGISVTIVAASGNMSANGVIATTLQRTDVLDQSGARWVIQVCPNASSPCAPNVSTPIAASSTDLSTLLSANLLGPRFQGGSGSYGYADVEVIPQAPATPDGAVYYNVNSKLFRQYSARTASWSGSSSSGTSGTVSPSTSQQPQVAGYNNGATGNTTVAPLTQQQIQSAAGVAQSYVGLVATRAETTTNFYTSATWSMTRSLHYARTTIPALGQQVVFQNLYVTTNNVEQNPGSGTFKASIEYPLGTVIACTYSGNATITVAGLADAITDGCGPAIPKGAIYWIRYLYQNSAGVLFSNTPGKIYSQTQEGFEFGTGTPDDKTAGGTVPAGDGTSSFMPQAIIGTTTAPSECLIGDSRNVGYGETLVDASLDSGELAKFIGPLFGYLKMAVTGSQASTFVANSTNRQRLLQYCSHGIDEYGVNDLSVGVTSANLATARTNIAALFGTKPVYGTTIPTEANTSTDNWATIANQTINVDTTGFNALVRAGISGEVGVFDVQDVFESLTPGTNKFPVGRIPGQTSGVANAMTLDGVHENSVLTGLIRNALQGRAAIITR